jgi:osmotically-inducible protein OsmY
MIRTLLGLLMLLGFMGCAATGPLLDADRSPDQELAASISSRLRSDPVTARTNLGVEVDDGVVTLMGRLDNKAVRLRALSVVQGTPGVRGVIDKTFSF